MRVIPCLWRRCLKVPRLDTDTQALSKDFKCRSTHPTHGSRTRAPTLCSGIRGCLLRTLTYSPFPGPARQSHRMRHRGVERQDHRCMRSTLVRSPLTWCGKRLLDEVSIRSIRPSLVRLHLGRKLRLLRLLEPSHISSGARCQPPSRSVPRFRRRIERVAAPRVCRLIPAARTQRTVCSKTDTMQKAEVAPNPKARLLLQGESQSI